MICWKHLKSLRRWEDREAGTSSDTYSLSLYCILFYCIVLHYMYYIIEKQAQVLKRTHCRGVPYEIC